MAPHPFRKAGGRRTATHRLITTQSTRNATSGFFAFLNSIDRVSISGYQVTMEEAIKYNAELVIKQMQDQLE